MASRITAFLFLLAQLSLAPAYSQDGEDRSDSDRVNQETPSAAAANNALSRLDFGIDYVSQDGATTDYANSYMLSFNVPFGYQ